jgi:hypothetical protein
VGLVDHGHGKEGSLIGPRWVSNASARKPEKRLTAPEYAARRET